VACIPTYSVSYLYRSTALLHGLPISILAVPHWKLTVHLYQFEDNFVYCVEVDCSVVFYRRPMRASDRMIVVLLYYMNKLIILKSCT